VSEKKVYLIDGNAVLYRSFYAIRGLSTSKGFPTNAIYGFINTLRKIIDREKPGYLGIVFDAPGPTVRHEAYKEYKAHRKPMPDDLAVQIPKLREVIQALRIPVFVSENYEADDVLGSLARKAAARSFSTVIVTTDKDLLQLVDQCTFIYNPVKEIVLDEAAVRESFGAAPAQVADVLSLWGDPTDNIPGVPGIGEKTAKSLVQEFGSVENLLRNLEKIKNPKVREKIEQSRDKLEISRQLVRIENELDVEFEPDRFKVAEPDTGEAVRLFQELEFTSLVSEYLKKAEPERRAYTTILTETDLTRLVARIRKAGMVSVDTETDSRFPTRARLVGMSFAVEPGEAYYLPLRHDYPGAPAQLSVESAFGFLRSALEDPKIRKVGQNSKYDFIVLTREGMTLRGLDLDTMVLSYLLEPNWGKHSLDRLALAYLKLPSISYSEVAGKGKAEVLMNQAAIEKVAPYACQDADYALGISHVLWPQIEAEKLASLYRDIERPLVEILAEMEMAGIKVDARALAELSAELEGELSRLEKAIYESSGTEFNINSPQQLGQILFHKLLLPASKKTKATRGFSTSMEVLEELAPLHPLVRHVLDYRQLSKFKSTYADALGELIDPASGRIHTCFNQTVAATGRLSSSEPNLQNIPARGEWGRRFRRAFVPEPGCLFLGADYSQIELRVLAHMSEDPGLIETFVNDRDVHAETAKRVFGPGSGLSQDEQRRRAKIINFSIIYGASAFSLAKELQTSTSEAQEFIDRYYARFPKVKEFLDRLVEDAKSCGGARTLFGRKRQVPELAQSDRGAQQAGRRIALNMPLQGTAADLIKKAMIDVWREFRRRELRARMILQVHDELVFEVPEGERETVGGIVREKMERVAEFKVPLKVSLGWGANWAEAK
jgi:DNA polymerase-1